MSAISDPAAPGGSPLTYRSYVLLAGLETAFATAKPGGTRPDAVAAYRSSLASAGMPAREIDAFLSTTMRASRDAPPARGTFPLVLIAQGNGQSAHDQAFFAHAVIAR